MSQISQDISVLKFVRFFFWEPHKVTLGIAFGFTLLSAFGFVYFGYGFRLLMDGYRDSHALFIILVRDVLLLFMALVLIFFVSTYLRIYLLNWVSESAFAKIRNTIFEHTLHLNGGRLEHLNASDLNTRFNNDKAILDVALSSAFPLGLRNIMISISSCVFLFLLNHDLTFFLIFWLSIMLLSTLSFRTQLAAFFQSYQKTLTRIGSYVEQTFAGILSVCVGYSQGAQDKFEGLSQESFHRGVAQVVLRFRSVIWSSILGFLALIFVFLFGFEEVRHGDMSHGQLTSYIIYAMTAMVYMNALAENIIESIQAVGALRRLARLVYLKPINHLTPLFVGSGDIVLRKVSFSLDRGKRLPLVHACDGYFSGGEHVAIAGPPACGKTTLLKLLSGIYAPSGGEIRIADLNPHQMRTDKAWISSVAYLGGDQPFFEGSLREHLNMDGQVSDERLFDVISFLDWNIDAAFPEGPTTSRTLRITNIPNDVLEAYNRGALS
jgi:ABC-type bacteriocin/lantibiotic exporter with double-glycine peptidase domain